MNKLSILKFDELVRLWKQGDGGVSIPELLGLVANGQNSYIAANYSIEELYERFRNTWWEVVWPNHKENDHISKGVQCRYIADSLPDVLRNRHGVDLPNVEAKELLMAFDLDDESEDIENEKLSRYLVNC